MSKRTFFYSSYTNPWINLAIENHLVSYIPCNEKYLLLYKNEPAIVMGRFQNPWLECDIAQIKEDEVHLVRRQSGGGTVYHDLGNMNYCFINGTRNHQKDENHAIVIAALKRLGINAYASGRSDLMVKHEGDEKKISGSAFKQKKESSFHHGTLLIDSDLNKLNAYLKTKHEFKSSKSIASNPSRVINTNEINTKVSDDLFVKAITDEFAADEDIELDASFIDQEYLKKIQEWDWRFGETPYFQVAIPFLEEELDIRKGRIEKMNKTLDSKLIGHKLTTELLRESDFNEREQSLVNFLVQGQYIQD